MALARIKILKAKFWLGFTMPRARAVGCLVLFSPSAQLKLKAKRAGAYSAVPSATALALVAMQRALGPTQRGLVRCFVSSRPHPQLTERNKSITRAKGEKREPAGIAGKPFPPSCSSP